VNVLAVPGELLGDVNELNCDDPGKAADRRHRYQDGDSDGQYAADARSLQKRDHRSQNKRQDEGKCQGDENFAGEVQRRDRTKQHDQRPLIGAWELAVRCADGHVH
jgi:hypothetical protein